MPIRILGLLSASTSLNVKASDAMSHELNAVRSQDFCSDEKLLTVFSPAIVGGFLPTGPSTIAHVTVLGTPAEVQVHPG